MLEVLLNKYMELSSTVQTLIILAGTFLAYKGVLKLPFISVKSKYPTKHSDCKLYNDMNKIIKDSVDLSRAISKLYYEIHVEQDNYLDIIHEEILLKMLSDVRTLNPTEEDLKKYKKTIIILEKELKKAIVKWLRENHYSEYTNEAFEQYIKDKTSLIIDRIGNELSDEIKGYSFNRDQLLSVHQTSLIPYAKEQYRKAFVRAREITIDKESKIKELEKNKSVY